MAGDRFSYIRILKLGLGGAIGGLLTFVLLYPVLRGRPLFGVGGVLRGWEWAGVATAVLIGAAIGFTIGACLISAEEWHTHNARRILRRSLTGALAGIVGGALGGLDGMFAFTVFQPGNLLLARCAGWALLGAGAGICPGFVAGSYKRAQLGAFGGLIGGALGGMLFDSLAVLTRSADLSRALGLVLVGAAIGIAVGFLEEMAKEYWLTILTGSKEGQSIPLSKDETTIGRDETVDIPLFGDNSVEPAHARIVKSAAGVHILGHPFTLNSQPTAHAPLSDGDIIGIGKHRLRFGARRSAQVVGIAAPIPQQAPPGGAQQAPAANASSLQVVSGPHSGVVFALSAAAMPIGRTAECSIVLPNDSLVSRRHAEMVWDGACWVVEDRGSTNGVYVNGRRVSAQAIHPGDEITVGQSSLRVI